MVNFDCSKTEARLIAKIANRAVIMAANNGVKYPFMDCEMDVTAVHCNGCTLNLERLLAADDFNFAHDVFGIRRHIDRETGKLQNCFLPRFNDHRADI